MYNATQLDVIAWESCKTPEEIGKIFGDRQELSPLDVIASAQLETDEKVWALCHSVFWTPQEEDAIKLAIVDFVFDVVELPGAIKELRFVLQHLDSIAGSALNDSIMAAEAEREYLSDPVKIAIADILLHSTDFEYGFFTIMTRILSNIILVNFLAGRKFQPINAFLQVATSRKFSCLNSFLAERGE